jgi:putative colanic acid biosynthesis acetyltransferase WcaF
MGEMMERGPGPTVRLDLFDSNSFKRGRGVLTEALWLLAFAPLMTSQLPGSRWRVSLLRAFGARIGKAVVIKPHVIIKFPWRLTVGDHSWIGERVWIDNLAPVSIGSHVCISQGAYLCTGSHDWSRASFDLITKHIHIEESAWVCAKAVIGPGVTVGKGAVVGLGAVATVDVPEWRVFRDRQEELGFRKIGEISP